MASAVDIANLALANIGETAEVSSLSPPDGSVQAMHCARFYPIARRQLQEIHAWDFCIRRITLAQSVTDPPSNWAFRYALPATAIRVLAVLEEDSANGDESEPYLIETLDDGTRTILTNVETADCRYLVEVSDTTKFSAWFVGTCGMLLASMVAGPIIKGDKGMKVAQYWFNMAMSNLGIAGSLDANGSSRTETISGYKPTWLINR